MSTRTLQALSGSFGLTALEGSWDGGYSKYPRPPLSPYDQGKRGIPRVDVCWLILTCHLGSGKISSKGLLPLSLLIMGWSKLIARNHLPPPKKNEAWHFKISSIIISQGLQTVPDICFHCQLSVHAAFYEMYVCTVISGYSHHSSWS